MPESIRNMITPPRNSAPRLQDDEPAASRTPVQAAAPSGGMKTVSVRRYWQSKKRV